MFLWLSNVFQRFDQLSFKLNFVMDSNAFDLRGRLKAVAFHLLISAFIGGIAAALVLGLWYPWPYRQISGGQALFLLILSVDLTLGPLLTFVVFNRSKTKTHLARDLVVIAALQLSGLSYGLYTVFLARPVGLVFEADRLRVVTDIEVVHDELPRALPQLRTLSLTGPVILGTRSVRNSDEKLEAISLALKGSDIGVRPSFWQPYAESREAVLQRARPLSALYKKYPDQASNIDREVSKTGKLAGDLDFLPVMGRESNWIALLDAKNAEVLGFVQCDVFFSASNIR